MPSREKVKDSINEIEAELKRLGWWRSEPLPPEAYDFQQAFAMDTMPFAHWLQFIFIPRVNAIVESGQAFPRSSQVGAQAVREFDGVYEADNLITLLSAFDDLIERG